MYEYRFVKGHVEVFFNGEFRFSADTLAEAKMEVESLDKT